jgi:hypothetical protein
LARTPICASILLASAALLWGDLTGVFSGGLDHPAIDYAGREVNDAAAVLNRRIQKGSVRLRYEPASGYLSSVLDALDVPVESQILVFSQTSVQQRLINPRNPRAIYFNDSAAVAWVRGEPFVEVAAQDPRQGVIFYTMDQIAEVPPWFTRRDDCLTCHLSHASLGVPGMMVRSVYPDPRGKPIRTLGDYLTDPRSPFEERWGGWYVTGKTGGLRHLGNMVVADPAERPAAAAHSLEHLDWEFDTSGYLTSYSDIGALLVFEHQMRLMNLITRVGWEVRAGAGASAIDEYARELADVLVFADERPLPGPVQSTSGFAARFAARGPRDRRGRSLRELDLNRSVMRYPCSYMIYSAAFDGLPAAARDAVYRRVWRILTKEENDPRYAGISRAAGREAIEILRDTKPGLPDYFR